MQPAHAGASRDACAQALGGLDAAGGPAELVRIPRPCGALLARRGFPPEYGGVALATSALCRGSFELAHAFEPLGALAALRWRRRGGGAVVLTIAEPPSRERLADRRGRLGAWAKAIGEADAIVAASDAVRAATERWLALELAVLAPGDGPASSELYRVSIAARSAHT